MTNQNPITPPPKLVEQWVSAFYDTPIVPGESSIDIATKAAQWGANQELEACCLWMERNYNYPRAGHPLRLARRPKPPSLKRVALLQLDTLNADLGLEGKGVDLSQIRRALEALDD